MDKTKGIGAGLLLVSIGLALAWLYQVIRHWSMPIDMVQTLTVLTTLALLAVFGLVGWIGYTMATMKVEVPAPPPPASPAPAEKKS